MGALLIYRTVEVNVEYSLARVMVSNELLNGVSQE